MIKVETVIETTPEHQIRISIDVLRREDATNLEARIAKGLEKRLLTIIQVAAKKARIDLETRIIKGNEEGEK